jgi:hypothetical protein
MFDIHKLAFAADGDWDDNLANEYCEGLMAAFAKSPEADEYSEEFGGIGIVFNMIDFGLSYPGVTPADMTLGDFREILFELFPRKMSVEPDAAPGIIAELRAFWKFVDRAYQLPQAHEMLTELDDDAVSKLREELTDPSNFGMAKSFFMMGSQAGFDMTTQEGLAEFQLAYNSSLLAGLQTAASGPRTSPTGTVSRSLTPAQRKARNSARNKQKKKSKRKRK